MPVTNDIESIGAGAASGAVAGPVGAAVGAAVATAKAAIAELAQHTARLKDAQQENQAMDALIPAWDADIQAIVAAYNSGKYDANDCIAAALAVDTQSFQYLRGLVGKPGTAWGGPTTSQIGQGNRPTYSAACNKSCTASCCVYLNDLRPGIFGRGGLGSAYQPWQTDNGSVTGLVELLQKGSGVLKIITVAAPPSQYGNFSRVGYNLTLTAPSPAQQLQDKVNALLNPPPSITLATGVVLGGGAAATATSVQAAVQDGSGSLAGSNAPASSTGVPGATNQNVLIVAIVFIALLFGLLLGGKK